MGVGRWTRRPFAPGHRAYRPAAQAHHARLAHGRLVVLGADGQRLHEEVITAGGEIVDGKFKAVSGGRVDDLFEAAAADPDAAPDVMQKTLVDLWPTHQRSVHTALNARARERASSLENALAQRAEKEVGDVTAILTELARNIEQGLAGTVVSQLELELFTDSFQSLLALLTDAGPHGPMRMPSTACGLPVHRSIRGDTGTPFQTENDTGTSCIVH